MDKPSRGTDSTQDTGRPSGFPRLLGVKTYRNPKFLSILSLGVLMNTYESFPQRLTALFAPTKCRVSWLGGPRSRLQTPLPCRSHGVALSLHRWEGHRAGCVSGDTPNVHDPPPTPTPILGFR